jgi:hypothetical protein
MLFDIPALLVPLGLLLALLVLLELLELLVLLVLLALLLAPALVQVLPSCYTISPWPHYQALRT